jgi:hypothetical protein
MTMKHAIMEYLVHTNALPFPPSYEELLEAIDAGWQNTQGDGKPVSTNNWIPVKLTEYPHAIILAKIRGYLRAENRLGWGVLVVTQDTFTKLLHHTPEDEHDNSLMRMFGLSGAFADWWTRQY